MQGEVFIVLFGVDGRADGIIPGVREDRGVMSCEHLGNRKKTRARERRSSEKERETESNKEREVGVGSQRDARDL